MNLRGTEWEGVDWLNLAKDEVQLRTDVNSVTTLRFPQKSGNFFTS
jgi:hypothetical protein